MLPKYWRFVVKNQTGQTVTYDSGARVAVRYKLWKYDSQGQPSESDEQSDDFGFGAGDTVADNSWEKMDAAGTGYRNNTSDKYLGLYGQLDVTTDHASTDGVIELYIEFSTNTSNWPTDDIADPDTGGEIEAQLIGPIASIDLDAAETESTNFEWRLAG